MSAVAQRKSITVIDGGKGRGGGSGGGAAGDDWKSKLTRTREGYVEGTLHNLMQIIEHDDRLAGLFWLNESSNQVLLSRDAPWPGGNQDEFTDADSCELAAWLQHPDCYWCKCRDETVLKAVISIARRHRRHPIREYLTGLEWDGKPRIEKMLVDMFGAPDTAYTRRAAQCFAVSAVSRALWFDPKNRFLGSKVDFMIVLEGAQGKKKSSGLQMLFGSEWFVETSESPMGKDFYQVIQGAWCVEIAEMDSFRRAEETAAKTAISRQTDKFRAPYERMPRSYRRECVLGGTTNEHQYLRDPTGGRRFLPVRVDGDIDLDGISRQRDQLWAEAVQMFRDGFQWWELPQEAAEEQDARYVGDSWEGRVDAWLGMRMPGDLEKVYPQRLRFDPKVVWSTTDEILQWAIGADPSKHTKPEQMRVANIMKRLGWEQKQRRWPEGGRERRWFRQEDEGEGPDATRGGDDVPPF